MIESESKVTVWNAASIMAGRRVLPETKGVYAFLCARDSSLLGEAGYDRYGDVAVPMLAGHAVLNIGSTARLTLRERVDHHLYGDSRRSSLRRTIGTVFGDAAGLKAKGQSGYHAFYFGDGEPWITDFFRENTYVAFRPSDDPYAEEWDLIKRLKPPFNIKGLEDVPFAQRLRRLRREMANSARP